MLRKPVKFLYTFIIISAAFFLYGCGFHIRSKNEISINFQHVKLVNKNVPDLLVQKIYSLFHDLDILDNSNYDHKFVLSNYLFSIPATNEQNSSYPTSATATLTVSYQVLNQDNSTCIPEKSISASETIEIPAGQVSNNNIDPMAKNELNKQLIENLFQQISSRWFEQAMQSSSCMPNRQINAK